MSRFTSRDLMVSVLDDGELQDDWADKTTNCTNCTNCTNVTNAPKPSRKPSKGSALAALRKQLTAARR
jgi:hypothetical protein